MEPAGIFQAKIVNGLRGLFAARDFSCKEELPLFFFGHILLASTAIRNAGGEDKLHEFPGTEH